MNIPRFLSRNVARALIGSTLLVTSTFAISNDELASLHSKAETNNGIAQYNLGLIYANQQEPVANLIEAYVWLNLAAENGATGKALMLVTGQMTPEQIEKGRALLEQRRADLAAQRPTFAPVVQAPAEKPVLPAAVSTAAPVVAAAASAPVVAASDETDNDDSAAQKKLRDELAGLWKENEQLKGELAKAGHANSTIDQLKRERDQLAATIATNTNEISTLRAAAANFEGERNALQQKADATLRQQNTELASELAAANARLKAAEAELAKAEPTANQLAAAQQTAASLQEQIARLTTENQQLAAQLKDAQTASSGQAASLEKDLGATKDELSKTKAGLADATARADAAAAELASLRDSHAALTLDLQKLNAEKNDAALAASKASDDANQQRDQLAERLKTAEESLAKISAERDSLAQQLADAQTAPKTDPQAQEQIASLTAELAALRNTHTELNAQVQKLSAEKDQAAELASKSTEEANRKNEELAGRLKTVEADLATLTAERDQASQQVASLSAERDELAQKLAAKPSKNSAKAKAQIEKLTAELETARREAEENRKSATEAADTIADLKAQVQKSQEALAASSAPTNEPEPTTPASPAEDPVELQKQLADTESKLETSLRSFQLQQAEIERLQAALANIDNERATLADRLQAAATQVSAASTQAAANKDAVAQLAGVREQLRQTQNQLAATARENLQLRNQLAFGDTASNSPRAEPAERDVSPEPAAQPRIHTVVAGETLSKIAKQYYGSSERWTEILKANQTTIRDPRSVRVGMKLTIP